MAKSNPPTEVKSGKLGIDPAYILPAFFLGVVNKPCIDAGYDKLSLDPRCIPDGAFWYYHQCGGTACLHRSLYGIFLPLWSLRDTEIRKTIGGLAASYGGYEEPFPIRELQIAFYSATEAFVPFMNVEEAFQWFGREQFAYLSSYDGSLPSDVWPTNVDPRITRIEDLPSHEILAQRALQEALKKKQLRTSPLEWPSLRVFENWLGHEGRVIFDRSELTAAFVYLNSD